MTDLDCELILELARLAHDGPYEETPWKGFLLALRRAMGANYANIVFRRAEGHGDMVEFSDSEADHGAIRRLFWSVTHGRDPFTYFAMVPDRLYDAAALLGLEDPAPHDFFQRFLEPSGMRWIRILRLIDPLGRDAWLTVTQTRSGDDFSPEAEAICLAAAPFFAQSLRTFATVESRQVGEEMAARIAGALGLGCVLLDPHGRISTIDAAAQMLLQQRGVEHLTVGERLRFTMGSAEADLREALRSIKSAAALSPTVIRADSEVDLLLVSLGTRLVPRAGAPVAALFIGPRHGQVSSGRRVAILSDLFGLTTRESQLALLLASGESLSTSASKLGITEQTARFYSKQVYSKMQVSGQGDLIRRLLTSVAMVV